jgi:GNAT superfamily N-acetyltransferase
MSDTPSPIRVVDRADPAAVSRLSDALTALEAAATGIHDARELHAEVRDHDGELSTGVYGWSSAGTCWVELLWVRDDHRGRGIGTALMRAVEAEARRRGCAQPAAPPPALTRTRSGAGEAFRDRWTATCAAPGRSGSAPPRPA